MRFTRLSDLFEWEVGRRTIAREKSIMHVISVLKASVVVVIDLKLSAGIDGRPEGRD